MAFEMILCPHCHTRVVPMADGTCPACRENPQQQPAPESEKESGNTSGAAWDKYQESLRPTPVEPSIAFLRQVERPFMDFRTDTVARLRTDAGPDIAAADRIRQELLPQFVTAVEQLLQSSAAQKDSDTSQLIEYAKTREESWRVLAEALSENDPEMLERHMELWGNSELLMLSVIEEKGSFATPTPAKRVKDFQRALVTFTPRLIATPAIVLANILVFAVMIATGVHFFEPTVQSVLDWGANFGPKTENGQWWRLVTCMFLHYGILHLVFNMWVLWDLGRVVERLVGNVGFVVLYFVSGIAGSIASLTWNPVVVSAGASGAVFGVAGALLGLIAFRRDTIPAPVLKHLWKSMAAFLIYNMIFGMMASGIDMAAHFGGLLAGFACGLILSQPLSVEMVVRRRFRNVAVAVAGAITLLLWTFALPKIPLPSCTSPEVAQVLERVVRSTLAGASLKSIDGHRELRYDREADIRYGQCVVHTDAEDINIKYLVEWQDREAGTFQVRTPAVLPPCTGPEVVKLLEQVIRSTLVGATLKSIDGHRELSYDRDADVRHGQCVVHTDTEDIDVRYLVEWGDRDRGDFRVRVPPTGLPACTSPQVIRLLEQVIRTMPIGGSLKSMDGHRELRHDRDTDVRYGQCVAHTEDGNIDVKYVVEWQDRESGQLIVRIPLTDLPSCTSLEVAQVLKQVVRSTLAGASLKSIDGHRELRYDREADIRYGQCVVHTDAGDIDIKYLVEWLERERGYFGVRTLDK